MLNTRQNFHHSKLPALGSIVTVQDRPRMFGHRFRRFIVEAFPLCDNVRPYSFGIHTAWIKALDNGSRYQVSGHFLVEA